MYTYDITTGIIDFGVLLICGGSWTVYVRIVGLTYVHTIRVYMCLCVLSLYIIHRYVYECFWLMSICSQCILAVPSYIINIL